MSLLPELGSLSANKDTSKQLASIRSYLSQLQDSMESELMNIGFDNLNGDLKKKFSSMSDDIKVCNESILDTSQLVGAINASYVNADQVSAIVGSFNYITANYLSSAELWAGQAEISKAFIGKLSSQVASFGYITANYMETQEFKSVIASFNYITSNYIIANNVLTDTMVTALSKTGYLQADSINASFISSKFTSSSSGIFTWINCADLKLIRANGTQGSIVFDDEGKSAVAFKPMTLNINGVNHRVLGAY